LTAGIARGLAGGARKAKTHTSRPNRWSRVKILGGWYECIQHRREIHQCVEHSTHQVNLREVFARDDDVDMLVALNTSDAMQETDLLSRFSR